MQIIYYIGSIRAAEVGQGLFDEVSAVHPEGRINPRSFDSHLPKEDPRTIAVMRIMEEHGYKISNSAELFDPSQKYYDVQITREYSNRDLDQMSYLMPRPKTSAGTLGRKNGIHILSHDYARAIAADRMTYAEDGNIIVTDDLRLMMEEAGLLNLVFLEARLEKPSFRVPESLWELTTDLRMPPLSDGNVLIDNDYAPYTGRPGQMCLPREGLSVPEVLYSPVELHYSSRSLAAIEPFDLARTFEPLGQSVTHQLVASQRFHQFCVAAHLRVSWQPVQVDPD